MKKVIFALAALALSGSSPPETSILVNTVSFADIMPGAAKPVSKEKNEANDSRKCLGQAKPVNSIKTGCLMAKPSCPVKKAGPIISKRNIPDLQ